MPSTCVLKVHGKKDAQLNESSTKPTQERCGAGVTQGEEHQGVEILPYTKTSCLD